jgi:acetate kinase
MSLYFEQSQVTLLVSPYEPGVQYPAPAKSGHLERGGAIILEGPKGRVVLAEGVVCALRHIHMSPSEAEELNVRDHDVVQVAVQSEGRPVVFGDVIVRVSPNYRLELHLDTDEGNAAGVGPTTTAHLVNPSV